MAHRLVCYVPNRVLDALDLVRARVRVGPGLAAGVRATEAADAFAGSYLSVYAGLPGPRGRKTPRLPVGLESRTGVEASVLDASTGVGMGPDYSTAETGASLHLAILGFDVGVDLVEACDLVLGLLFIDVLNDDL